MYSLLSFEFIFFFLYSIIAIIIAVLIPGNVLLRQSKLRLPVLSDIVISAVVGSSSLVLIGFVSGYLEIRIATYIYIILAAILWVRNKYWKDIKINLKKSYSYPALIIVVGSLLQLISTFFFNVKNPEGLSYCCVMVSDNLYFAALSQELVQRIPPYEPGLYGVVVNNYHYLSNLFVAEISRVFMIPITLLQFQVSSVYLSLMLGLSLLSLGRTLTNKWAFSLWLLFFAYFGGDLIWLVVLILQGPMHMFSMSSLEDGVKFLENPPRAYAVVQLFGGISMLIYTFKNKSKIFLLLTGVVFGTLIGFKVYIGIFAILGLVGLGIAGFFRKKYRYAFLALISILVSLAVYLPVNKDAGGLYFTSFWFFENFIVQPYLGLQRLELARIVFVNDGKIFKSLFFEAIFVCLTLFSIFGTKLIALFQFPSAIKLLPWQIHIFLISGILPSFFAGFFFQQTSGGSNTFNFIVNVLTVFSVYSASALTFVSKFRKLGIAITVVVVFLTIPRVLYVTYHNIVLLSTNELYYFRNTEVEALTFLKSQPLGLTLVDHKQFEMDKVSPYIRLYTNQPMFGSGIGILVSHGIKTDLQEKVSEIFEQGADSTGSAKLIKEHRIEYIVTGEKNPQLVYTGLEHSNIIFNNHEVTILKPSKEKIDKLLETKENEIKY